MSYSNFPNEISNQDHVIASARSISAQDLAKSIQDENSHKRDAEFDFDRLAKLFNFADLEVCEIGPGRGVLLNRIAEEGARVAAIDVSDDYLNNLDQDRISCFSLDICSAQGIPPQLRSRFDLILCIDVLEHLIRPQDALLNIHDLLKPSGSLYLRVPANESLIAYSQRLGCPYESVHLRTYTRRLIRRELNAVGFKVRSIRAARNSSKVPVGPLANQVWWNYYRRSVRQGWTKCDVPTVNTSRLRFVNWVFTNLGTGGANFRNSIARNCFALSSRIFRSSSEIWCVVVPRKQ